MSLTCDEIAALTAQDRAQPKKAKITVHEYVKAYQFEFDGGGTYTPTEAERAMLEDALEGFLAAQHP